MQYYKIAEMINLDPTTTRLLIRNSDLNELYEKSKQYETRHIIAEQKKLRDWDNIKHALQEVLEKKENCTYTSIAKSVGLSLTTVSDKIKNSPELSALYLEIQNQNPQSKSFVMQSDLSDVEQKVLDMCLEAYKNSRKISYSEIMNATCLSYKKVNGIIIKLFGKLE